MKLHHILVAAAILFAAGIAFADDEKGNGSGNGHNSGSSNSATIFSVSDYLTMDRSRTTTPMNVMMFRMNYGWKDSEPGYTDINEQSFLSSSVLSREKEYLYSNDDEKGRTDIAGMDIPDDAEADLSRDDISIYQLSIPFSDGLEEVSLPGGRGNSSASIYLSPDANGNDFFTFGEDNAIYFGKGNWIGQYSNGAMSLADAESNFHGIPLSISVITLLAVLGSGTAFVMYRNRKRTKT